MGREFLGLRGGVCGGAATSEFEPQQPASRVGLVCWSEPPFSGGFSCLAGEIPAWPWVFQQRVDDIARVVDDHEHRDLDAAVNGVTCAARNVGKLCMHYRGFRQRLGGLNRLTRNRVRGRWFGLCALHVGRHSGDLGRSWQRRRGILRSSCRRGSSLLRRRLKSS